MAVGLLESFGLIEEYGLEVLDTEEVLFAASARKRKGCRSIPNRLKAGEQQRVMELGRRIKKWKDEK